MVNPLMSGGNRRSYIYSSKLQVCVSMHDLLLRRGIKGLNIAMLSTCSRMPKVCKENITLKVHYCRFKNLRVCSCSYKNNTLKISHF